jgi:hypothetical protein
MSATIQFLLSKAGQKAHLLAGGNGAAAQAVVVAPDDPCFRDLLELAEIDSSGGVRLNMQLYRYDSPAGCRDPHEFDAVPSVRELLAFHRAQQLDAEAYRRTRADEQAAQEEAELREDKQRIESWAALPVGERLRAYGTGRGFLTEIDMPNLHYPARAEGDPVFQRATEEARAEAERRNGAVLAERQAAADAKERAEQARRAELGLQPGDRDFAIEDGALTAVPRWVDHRRCPSTYRSRGKNWLAIITADPAQPGGLGRSFADKAKGSSYYIVPELVVGQAVEFGADYYSGGGRRRPERWYGYVVRLTDSLLVLHRCDTGKAAIKEGAAFAAAAPDPDPDVSAAIRRVNFDAEGTRKRQ